MGNRRTWIVAAVLVLAAGGFWFWRSQRAGRDQPSYRTEAVQRGNISVQVTATGTVQAVTTVLVGSQVSGTISGLYADFNDRVRRGQVLAQLDPTFLRAQVEQTKAELVQAEVRVRQAERDSARVYPLQAGGMVSQVEIDAARTALDQNRAARAAARAALERVETNLRYATIESPIDGVVVSRNVDVGQTVAASLSAPTLFTIANDLTRMQLEVAVDEADIGMVKAGQKATFTVDAHPNDTFLGTVHQIRLAPETVQNVVTYTVVILVENPELKLLPGMTANVSILAAEARDVLKAPAMALRFRPANAPGAAGAAGAGVGAGGRGGANRASAGRSGRGGEGGSAMAAGGRPGGGRPGGPGGAGGPGAASGGAGGGAGGPGAENGASGVLWVLNDGAAPRPLPVRTGLSDGTYVQVSGEGLEEGVPVVLGVDAGGGAAAASQGAVNPFQPRFPGGRR
jgi:HlyD family secretion protein